MLAVSLGTQLLPTWSVSVDLLRASSQNVSQTSEVMLHHFCHISVIEVVTKSCPDLRIVARSEKTCETGNIPVAIFENTAFLY